MSYHSKELLRVGLTPIRSQWLYSLAIKCYRPGASTADPLAGRLLIQVAGTTLSKRICQPRQAVLGRMHGRSPRSIQRSLKALKDAGLVEVIRRGKQLSNIYRLARWLWCRLTNQGVTGQPSLPGLSRARDAIDGVLDGAKRAWEARHRGLVLATR